MQKALLYGKIRVGVEYSTQELELIEQTEWGQKEAAMMPLLRGGLQIWERGPCGVAFRDGMDGRERL